MANLGVGIDINGNSSGLVTAVNNAQRSLQGLTPFVDKTRLSVEQLKKSVASATGFIDSAGNKFNTLKTPLNNAASAFDKASAASGRATVALSNLGRVAQDAPFGFIGIANNINPLVESFVSLQRETGSTKGALLSLGSSLVGGGGLVLAFSLLSAGLSFLGQKMQKTDQETKNAKESADTYKKAVEGLKNATTEATGEAEAEIATVRRLAAIIKDSSESYSVRKRALEELQQINENYFGDLTLETSKYGELDAAVNKYASSLVNLKIKEKLSGQIADARIEASKAQKEFEKLNEKITIREADIKANVFQNTQTKQRFETGSDEVPTAIFQDNLNAARQRDNTLNKLYKDLNKASDEWGKFDALVGEYSVSLDDALVKTLNFASTNSKVGNEQRKAVEDARKKLLEQAKIAAENLKELQDNLNKLQGETLANEIESVRRQIEERKKLGQAYNIEEIQRREDLRDTLFKLENERLNREYEAEREAILKKGKLTDLFVQANLRELNKKFGQEYLQLRIKLNYFKDENEGDIGKANPFTGNSFLSDQLEQRQIEITSGIQGLAKKSDPSKIGNWLKPYQDKLNEQASEFVNNYKETQKQIKSGVEQAQSELQKTLISAPVDVFVGIGEAFGSAFEDGFGNSFAKAGETVIRIIGGILKQIGKYLIVGSQLVQKLQASLSTLFQNPTGGLAVGVLLVAVGTVLSKIKLAQQTPVKPFAEGGIVTGPTLGLIGEAGKEAVIPLDRFDEVVGNRGAANVFVTGQISGETIYLQQQRVSERRGRYL